MIGWEIMEANRTPRNRDEVVGLRKKIQLFLEDLDRIAGLDRQPQTLSILEARLGTSVFRFISDEKLRSIKELADGKVSELRKHLSVLDSSEKGALSPLQKSFTQVAYALRISGL